MTGASEDSASGQESAAEVGRKPDTSLGSVVRRTMDVWKRSARAVGVVQTRILMFLIYMIAVLPVGLLFRLSRDPLHMRRPDAGNWIECNSEATSLQRARQQF